MDAALTNAVDQLLSRAGMPGTAWRAHALTGGANNRVYRLDVAGRPLLLKAYYHSPGDCRDRLAAEFAFARFAWSAGLRDLPEPIACDPEHHLGLYEFVAGRRLDAGEPAVSHVRAATQFVAAINRHRGGPEAGRLPAASEACFSVAEHVACVRRRVDALGEVADAGVGRFVRFALRPAWEACVLRLERSLEGMGLSPRSELEPGERVISPSDFGFHNAIRRPDGRLCFIDFEYAGWDDPAKLVCDFLCQPAVPTPAGSGELVARAVADLVPDPGALRNRLALLLPMYRIKWCCIMLNEHLPGGAQRRRFAASLDEQQWQQRGARQLILAQRALDNWQSPARIAG